MDQDQLFAPPGEAWQQVSHKLVDLRRLVLLVSVVLCTAAVAVVLGLVAGPVAVFITVGAGLVVLVWGLWLIPRNWRAWGYAERLDDLLVTHGVMYRRLTVVPYGRMQFVDVASGPLERRYGLATVQLHTASPATDAKIPGLPAAEAARLRDRLSALGEAQAAGL
ncbi:PH domain-containing protein [Jiangella mangrovi]|uniref:Membrane protein YdbS with pleckstrin-like domain n=1 Tax=Jiangella mangrovi TaxID=1524084 RepID=A0A7W9LK34_9ACTN|nr:membrane protein YdbS with pleckstrin-like domain [Jiangella mangrovi]